MTMPFDTNPERELASPPPAMAALADGHDEPWGYECALPFLQVMGDSLEPEPHEWPRADVR